MYARAVTLDLDAQMWDELVEFGTTIKDRISGFPGLISWVLVANRETGKGTSFSVFEDEDAFLTVNDQINEIVSDFGRFFTAPPVELLGDVLTHLDNEDART